MSEDRQKYLESQGYYDVPTSDPYTEKTQHEKDLDSLRALINKLGLDKGAVTGEHIALGVIGSAHIKEASINNLHVQTGAIQTAHIGNAVIQGIHVKNGTIENIHILDSTIDNTKIANATITGAKIALATIDTANIKDASITSAKIGTAQINTAHIGIGQITNALISDASITNAKIQDGTIVGAKLFDATIDNTKIANATITGAKIATATIDNVNIKDATISGAKIGLAAIGSSHLGTAIVDTAHIKDASITSAKILDLVADKITTGTLSTTKITISGVGGFLRISGNRLQVFDNSPIQKERVSLGDVDNNGTLYGLRVRGADGTTVLYDHNGVYNAGITDGAITNPKIGDNAIDDRVIKADSIMAKHILASTITGDKIATNTITASKIDVTDLRVGSTQIIDASITTAKIGDAQITNAKIHSLDATKITSGFIDAGRIKIGANVTFDEGFDPTKIKVGGINLLEGTKNYSGWTNPSVNGYVTANTWDGLTIQEQKADWSYLRRTGQQVLTNGKEYIASVWLKSSVGGVITPYYTHENADNVGSTQARVLAMTSVDGDTKVTTEWKRWKVKFIANGSNHANGVRVEASGFGTSGAILQVTGIKLEEGNKDTSWSPSPKDVDASISTAQSTADGVKTLTDGWKYPNTTYIDGGDIYTGTVTANQIASKTITANQIAAGTITASEIKANTITATSGIIQSLSASVITTGTLDANVVTVNNLKASSIVSGTLNADLVTISNGKVTINSSGVTVTDADFYVKDKVTGYTSVITQKHNMIKDHSFELAEIKSGSVLWNSYYHDVQKVYEDGTTNDSGQSEFGKWAYYGTPKLMTTIGTDFNKDIMFGKQVMLVGNGHSVRQTIPVEPGQTYTISFHHKRPSNTSLVVGAPVLDVYHKYADSMGNLVQNTWWQRVYTAPQSASAGAYERVTYTVTVPTTYSTSDNYISIVVYATNTNGWAEVDGFQMVKGAYASPYVDESATYDLIRNPQFKDLDTNTIKISTQTINDGTVVNYGGGGNEKIRLDTGGTLANYIGYWDNYGATRWGYLGFGSTANTHFHMVNERSGGRIFLMPDSAAVNFEFFNLGGFPALRFGGKVILKSLTSSDRIQVRSYSDGAYAPIDASAFAVGSKREFKTNISPITDSALAKINKTTAYRYNLKAELENGIAQEKLGLIFEESPNELKATDETIDLYAMNTLLWKAVQELSAKVDLLQQGQSGQALPINR